MFLIYHLGKKNTAKEIIQSIEEKFQKKLLVKIKSVAPDEKYIWSDISKAKKSLKFKPKIDIEMGIKLIKDEQEELKKRINKH